MYVYRINESTIKHIDNRKTSMLELSNDIKYHDFFSCLPSYIKEIHYSGFDKDILSYLKLQYTEPVLGVFKRPHFFVELDITTKCNLACNNCIKMSNLKSTWFTLTLDDIDAFINKVKEQNVLVKILGGEPTLHKDLDVIIDKLKAANFLIILTTNGLTKQFNDKYKDRKDIIIENSAKSINTIPEFHTFMEAPRDSSLFDSIDYSKGCSIAADCGYGYKDGKFFACPVAPHIESLINKHTKETLSLGKNSLLAAAADRPSAFRKVCQYCGMFKKLGYHDLDKSSFTRTDELILSNTWSFVANIK